MSYRPKCILEVKKGDWEWEAILNCILDDYWSGKEMFHSAIDVGQKTFLETDIYTYDAFAAKEMFQSETVTIFNLYNQHSNITV